MKQITQYIIALTNLYGITHKNKVVEIYNSQNDDTITIEDIDIYFTRPSKDLGKGFIETHKDYFVHESIMEFHDFESTLRKKADKPHYIPDQKELLKYVDDLYFERNKEYNTLLNYFTIEFFDGDMHRAESLCENIQGLCQFSFSIEEIFSRINNYGIEFKDENQVRKVVQMIISLSNNIRLWENNGFTADEIVARYDENAPGKVKIGRNQPCPCGSGKKYKRCCLGTDPTQLMSR